MVVGLERDQKSGIRLLISDPCSLLKNIFKIFYTIEYQHMENEQNSAQYKKSNSPRIDIELVKTILESGNSVELPASGYSMFPTLRPGDLVIVKPFEKEALPNPGTVVIYEENNSLVMHRLIRIQKNDQGDLLFITRGDSLSTVDNQWKLDQLVGVAQQYKRLKIDRLVKPSIPGELKYMYNRNLLWLFVKRNRLKKIIGLDIDKSMI